MIELTVSEGSPLESELRRASVLCRAQRVKEVRLILPRDIVLNATLVDALAEFVEQSGVRGLSLVHSSNSMGFVCSALRLRCPRSEVSWTPDRSVSKSLLPPANPAETKSGRHRVAPVVKANWVVLDAEPDELDRTFLYRAFETIRELGASRVALGLKREYRLTPDWTLALVEEIRQSPALRELLLVHPSLVAGFVASSVGLECPGVRVSSASKPPGEPEKLP